MDLLLVTGVAGFIGWKTSELLLASGYRVIGIDNLNDAYDVRLKYYRLRQLQSRKNFKFYEVDIENWKDLRQLFQDHHFDAVVHLAARAGVRDSLVDPEIYFRTNVLGTLNLMNLMRDFKVKKLVLASTSSLYAGKTPPFREDLPVDTPISPYAASKKAAEEIGYTYHYLYGLDIVVLRYFTVYGPAGRPDMSIFRFIKWIDEGVPVEIFGDGSQSRDFTFVEDIARGTMQALGVEGYDIINLGGGGDPVSLNQVIAMIEEKLGKRAILRWKEFHKADIKQTQADITKAKQRLHWKPEISFEQGIEMTLQWYVENREWLSNVQL